MEKEGAIAQLNAKLEGADEKLRSAVLEEQGRLKEELFARDTMISNLKKMPLIYLLPNG